MSPQLFYSLSKALFFEDSCNKAKGLLFIFFRISTGHAHFQNNNIHISWELVWFSTQKESYLQAKAYLHISVIQALFMGCFYQLMVCSCGRRKTKKYVHVHTYMYIHTQTDTQTFRKTVSRNQAHAHSWS